MGRRIEAETSAAEELQGTSLDQVDAREKFLWLLACTFHTRQHSPSGGVAVSQEFQDRLRELAGRLYQGGRGSQPWEERFDQLFALVQSEGYGEAAMAHLARMATDTPSWNRGTGLERKARLSGGSFAGATK
jgi:hypothetical protein